MAESGKSEGVVNEGGEFSDTDDYKVSTLKLEHETGVTTDDDNRGVYINPADSNCPDIGSTENSKGRFGKKNRSKRKSKEFKLKKDKAVKELLWADRSLEVASELETESETFTKSENTVTSIDLDSEGARDEKGSNADAASQKEEEELPKVPRIDCYFVLLAIVFVSTVIGVTAYFSIADIIDPPVLITKESVMPFWFKERNATEIPELTEGPTESAVNLIVNVTESSTKESSTEGKDTSFLMN